VVEIPTIVAHGDADGLLSTAILLKNLDKEPRIFFSSPLHLRDTICKSLLKRKADEAYILDLFPTRESVAASSIYSRAIWLDHHVGDLGEKPSNVEFIKDTQAKSAAQVVGDFLGVEDELIPLANQIEVNQTQSIEAEQLRGLVGYHKKYNQGLNFALEMRDLALSLAREGLDRVLSSNKNLQAIGKYELYLKKLEKNIEEKIKVYQLNGKKIALYRTRELNPVYFITEKLKEHSQAPFDYIVVAAKREGDVATKLEFRTHSGENVLNVARCFNGGGHKVASGATVKEQVSNEDIVRAVKSLR